jgi:hypothetical protein
MTDERDNTFFTRIAVTLLLTLNSLFFTLDCFDILQFWIHSAFFACSYLSIYVHAPYYSKTLDLIDNDRNNISHKKLFSYPGYTGKSIRFGRPNAYA